MCTEKNWRKTKVMYGQVCDCAHERGGAFLYTRLLKAYFYNVHFESPRRQMPLLLPPAPSVLCEQQWSILCCPVRLQTHPKPRPRREGRLLADVQLGGTLAQFSSGGNWSCSDWVGVGLIFLSEDCGSYSPNRAVFSKMESFCIPRFV